LGTLKSGYLKLNNSNSTRPHILIPMRRAFSLRYKRFRAAKKSWGGSLGRTKVIIDYPRKRLFIKKAE